MAYSITVANLFTEIRARAEIRSAYIGDTDLLAMLQGSYEEYYDLMLSVDPSQELATSTITVSSGSGALPATFYKALCVEVLDTRTSSSYTSLQRRNYQSRNWDATETPDNWLREYEIRDGYLYLYPVPSSSVSVRFTYIPVPQTLATDTTLSLSIPGKEYLVLSTVIKCLSKEESDTGPFFQQLMKAEARIREMGEQDQANPIRVVDVYSRARSRDRKLAYRFRGI